jgi:hypothetical protein
MCLLSGYGETCTVGTTTQPTTTTTQQPPTVPPDFCDNIIVGLFPHPEECTMFVICLFEVPNLYTCPYPTEVFFDGSCVGGKFNFFNFVCFKIM